MLQPDNKYGLIQQIYEFVSTPLSKAFEASAFRVQQLLPPNCYVWMQAIRLQLSLRSFTNLL